MHGRFCAGQRAADIVKGAIKTAKGLERQGDHLLGAFRLCKIPLKGDRLAPGFLDFARNILGRFGIAIRDHDHGAFFRK